MQATLIDADGDWAEETRLFQLDANDYFVTTVTELDVEVGDRVDVLVEYADPHPSFEGLILETAVLPEPERHSVITVTREGRDAL